MVSENADMALDDFIQKNKITGRFGKGGSRGGGRGGGDRRGGRGGGRGNDRGGDRVNRSGDRGAVNKRGGGGGGGGFSSRRNRNLPDRWEHDMYSGGRLGGASGGGGGNKLIVNNLDFGVTDADMEELFAEFGTLKKASILYDRSGRSTGSAEIEFLRGSDARQAKEQYHQVPLDGRAMTITIVGSDSNGRDGGRDRRDGGFRDRSPRGGGNRRNNSDRNNRDGDRPRRGGRGGGRGGGNRREKKEDITQEQLDAEMDDYLNKRNDE